MLVWFCYRKPHVLSLLSFNNNMVVCSLAVYIKSYRAPHPAPWESPMRPTALPSGRRTRLIRHAYAVRPRTAVRRPRTPSTHLRHTRHATTDTQWQSVPRPDTRATRGLSCDARLTCTCTCPCTCHRRTPTSTTRRDHKGRRRTGHCRRAVG